LVPELRDDPAPAQAVEDTTEPPTEPAEQAEQAPDPVAALTDAVAGLAKEVNAHHARAAARERVIDNLHAEVERLRVGERNLALRPITTDLQRLRTDLLRQAAELPADIGRAQVADLLESFALTVEQTLERCGVVPIRPEPGAEFAARQHRAVKVIATTDPSQDGTIAEIRADGYLDTATDRVTDPARVVVWQLATQPAESAQGEKSEDG
jgi:molecular chaperone GrpE